MKEGRPGEVEKEREHLRHLAVAIRARLLFHQQCGIRSYPRIAPFSLKKMMTGGATPGRSGAQPRRPGGPGEVGKEALALESVHAAVRACCGCALAETSAGRLVGVGDASARLLVVGDFALQGAMRTAESGAAQADFSEAAGSLPAPCFGSEEDALFWKMMQAIQLRPRDVYVTNALKCPMAPGQELESVWLGACRRHLACEIDAVRPHLICAMGEHAAAVLLGRGEPVARLRGSVHQLQIGEGAMACPAVVVTYHPRFLLRVEEMKKAAWQDLQRMRDLLRRRGGVEAR